PAPATSSPPKAGPTQISDVVRCAGHFHRHPPACADTSDDDPRFQVLFGFLRAEGRPTAFFEVFSATAARTSACSGFASILSPSRMSMARLTLPSRLELNRPAGSSREAP